jgi:hypothetical protein
MFVSLGRGRFVVDVAFKGGRWMEAAVPRLYLIPVLYIAGFARTVQQATLHDQ